MLFTDYVPPFLTEKPVAALHQTVSIAYQMPVSFENVTAILTDIEGTTTSISFVHDTLFPYAKQNIGPFLQAHQNEPAVSKLIIEVKETAGTPDATLDEVIATLVSWMNQDKKITPLKSLQGLIWEEGYTQGKFHGQIYADAYEQLKNWKKQGKALYVYSSGSVHAQKLLFSLFSGYFDTKVGGKKEKPSYIEIARQMNIPAQNILFLSDIVEELDAAKQAGMQTLLLSRDYAPPASNTHPSVTTFNQIGNL